MGSGSNNSANLGMCFCVCYSVKSVRRNAWRSLSWCRMALLMVKVSKLIGENEVDAWLFFALCHAFGIDCVFCYGGLFPT